MRAAAICRTILVAAVICASALPAAARAGVPCRLALVLALDISSSVDSAEDRLQRGGVAAALRSPDVMEAFLSEAGSVALHAFEWSGGHRGTTTLLDWTLIETPEDLAFAAEAIGGSRRSNNDLPTALGLALTEAAVALRRGPDCDARKVDVSGDGPSNDGYSPRIAYSTFDFDGITVNGLAILGSGSDGEIDLVDYYTSEVLHGPGAFVEVAQGYEDYARAIRRKLLRELVAPMMSDRREKPTRLGTGRQPG